MEKTVQDSNIQKPEKHSINHSIIIKKIIFGIAVILCLSSLISPPVALLLGLIVAWFMGHPYLHLNHKATQKLLQFSVVGLGFGMNVNSAMKAGKAGILFTIASIFSTFVIGYAMGKFLKIEKKTSYLISTGTAICGGSAIAAVAPVIKAEEKDISMALGTVFILNSLALFIFPFIGHALKLSQTQFGLWCAIAIHDTSSVVGAASKYGFTALEVATTVKLARALWIIPVVFISTIIFKNKKSKIKIPYFIGFFVIAMIINTYLPFVQKYSQYMVTIAKSGLTLTLFLIGSGLSQKVMKSVGIRPFIQGVVLWILISVVSLFVITFYI